MDNEFDELNTMRGAYARRMENGKRIQAFTGSDEWHWYVDNVLQPTITDYTERLLEGKTATDKEDWMLRGMINGLRMVITSTETFVDDATKAREQAKKLEEEVRNAG
jgi:hypothetical protein